MTTPNDTEHSPSREHWQQVYRTRTPETVSWFQPHARTSLDMIKRLALAPTEAILDVGGGASVLVDNLLDAGHTAISVLDVSAAALAHAQARLGARGAKVTWIEADIRQAALPAQAYALWHDRAAFHFLTKAQDREAYVAQVLRALKPGGHLIVATFASDGPLRCSGLEVARYRAEDLHAAFGTHFALVEQRNVMHHTPSGAAQSFVYCCLQRVG